MQMSGNTILITGGSSGIGMALAERFLKLENEVIVTGRREDQLQKMKEKFPRLHVRVSDAGLPHDREALARWASSEFPKLNVLVNNAGIQRKANFVSGERWSDTAQEIDINFSGPIHLSELFIPHLSRQAKAHIMNVSSGLAFVPLAHMPVYCATKAALHSFTLSLRHQLRSTPIEVTEIIPPAVKTNLGGAHDFGVELAEFADAVIAQLRDGKPEITYGFSQMSSFGSRSDLDKMFANMNQR